MAEVRGNVLHISHIEWNVEFGLYGALKDTTLPSYRQQQVEDL